MDNLEFEELLSRTSIYKIESDADLSAFVNVFASIKAPEKVYRYRRCTDWAIEAFKNDEIFTSRPTDFNDPYDCLPYINLDRLISTFQHVDNALIEAQVIAAAKKLYHNEPQNFSNLHPYAKFILSHKIAPDTFDGMTEDEFENELLNLKAFVEYVMLTHKKPAVKMITKGFVDRVRTQPRIACFSESKDSTLMWAHYSDSHTGFALEYDTSDLANPCESCAKGGRMGALLLPVIYGDARYDCTDDLSRYIENCTLRNWGVDKKFDEIDMLFALKANLYKSIDWKYEKEWRFFEAFSAFACGDNTRCTNIKPTAILLGCKIHDHHKISLCHYAKGKGMPVYQMDSGYTCKQFELESKQIE